MLTNRLSAARRTILRRTRQGLRYTRRSVALEHDGRTVALLSSIRIRDGVTAIEGACFAPGLALATEQETWTFPAPDDAFSVRLTGCLRLTWSLDASPIAIAAQAGFLDRLRAGALMVQTLLGFAVSNARNLIGYFVLGDGAAGDRLEDALLRRNARPLTRLTIPRRAEPMALEQVANTEILVPVHNAAEATRRCLASLARHTDADIPVTIIDDASTDAALSADLEAWVAQRPRARLIRHERNHGFVEAVNAGLAARTGHVVILNSDAEVPADWLPRLVAPILQDTAVASVTPMSNHAEILSVPVPARFDLARIDAVASELDPATSRARLPTGVGFCMALSGPWLDRVPKFDPAFGRGYGEEVDWCQRTAAMGARHLGISSLFVAHDRHASFGTEVALAATARARRLVERRYPGFEEQVSDYKARDPLLGAKIALGLASAGQPVDVYIAHHLGGGAELWLQGQIAAHTQARGVALVLRSGPSGITCEFHTEQGLLKGLTGLEDLRGLLGFAPALRLKYSCAVGAPDALPFVETVFSARRPGDRAEIFFHDFFPLCPSQALVGHDGRYCALPGPQPCQRCYVRLAVTNGKRPAEIASWRAGWHALALAADALVTFSDASREIVATAWPDLAECIEVRPHILPFSPRLVAPPRSSGRIGVLGDIGRAKGADVLRALAEDHAMEITIIGQLDPNFSHSRLHVHGAYRPAEIADLAERYRISAWFIPSICPETFSFTTHECLATGLPVVAFDLGAQGSAVRAAGAAHRVMPLADPTDRAAMADLARSLRDITEPGH